jgi:hypothetical protein
MSRNYVKYSSRSMLSDSDVIDIRRDADSAENFSVRELAAKHAVPKSTVHDILTGKTWSHVPNPVTVYKNYSIFPDGRVWSNKTSKFLQAKMAKSGTLSVELQVNGTRQTVPVASLVAKAFLGKKSTKLSFVDGDSTNVHFTNIAAR